MSRDILVALIVVQNHSNGKLLRRISSVGYVLALLQAFPAFHLARFPSGRFHIHRKTCSTYSLDHLPNAPLSFGRLFELQQTPPRSSQNLFQRYVSAMVHPSTCSRILQSGTIECTLAHHYVWPRTRFPQQMLSGSCVRRHPSEHSLSRYQRTQVTILVYHLGRFV